MRRPTNRRRTRFFCRTHTKRVSTHRSRFSHVYTSLPKKEKVAWWPGLWGGRERHGLFGGAQSGEPTTIQTQPRCERKRSLGDGMKGQHRGGDERRAAWFFAAVRRPDGACRPGRPKPCAKENASRSHLIILFFFYFFSLFMFFLSAIL